MIKVYYRYRGHIEDIGWSNLKIDRKREERERILIVGRGYGFSDEQIIEIYETIEKLGSALKKIADAVAKAIYPVIEFLKETWFENFDFYSSPEKKKIYQSDYRVKSNLKNYEYIPNYRGRMFCVGNRGNYRRF